MTPTPDAPEQTPDATEQPAGPPGPSGGPPAREAGGSPVPEARLPRPARRQSVRGIILTLLVVVGFVLAFVALVPRPSTIPQPVVDVAAAAAGTQDELGFPPSVPNGLGPGWTATSAFVQRGVDGVPTWRVNYSTPRGSWVSLIQGREATKEWEDTQIVDGSERGSVDVGGTTFVVRARPDRSLTAFVLRGPEVTTMFAGRANRAEMEELVRATALPAG